MSRQSAWDHVYKKLDRMEGKIDTFGDAFNVHLQNYAEFKGTTVQSLKDVDSDMEHLKRRDLLAWVVAALGSVGAFLFGRGA